MLALQIPLPEPCLPEPCLPVAPAITPRTVRQDCVEPRSASGDKLDVYLEKRGRTLKCAIAQSLARSEPAPRAVGWWTVCGSSATEIEPAANVIICGRVIPPRAARGSV